MGRLSSVTEPLSDSGREAAQFAHCLVIPWRPTGIPRYSHFIQKWLYLGILCGPSWTSDLSEHIVESDGKLSVNNRQFRRIYERSCVPKPCFPSSQSEMSLSLTIILTSRPGAHTPSVPPIPWASTVPIMCWGSPRERRSLLHSPAA